METTHYIISKVAIDQLGAYLGTKPYQEVRELIVLVEANITPHDMSDSEPEQEPPTDG